MSKLTIKDKIEIYERRKKDKTISLIKKHGYDILRKDKNRTYYKDFKLQIINRILISNEFINSITLDIGLVSSSILHNWISKFKENGYNVSANFP